MTDKISINEACMKVGEQLQRKYGDKPIPVGELNQAVVDLCGCKKSAVLQSDRCYNRTNKGMCEDGKWEDGKLWDKPRLFLSRGKDYEYVGPDDAYFYSGPVWHLTPDNIVAWCENNEVRPPTSTDDFPDEVPADKTYPEGATKQVVVNAYERNAKARAACVDHYGPACVVCGFCFADFYGPTGDGYIHVHHLRDLATIGEQYEVDPVADLNPVCPNCHAMLHRRRPAMNIEDLRAMIEEQRRRRETLK